MTDDDDTGYKRPPKSTRFEKGRSGNPAGRPRGRHLGAPHETVLGQFYKITENGRQRRVSATELLYLQLAKRGIEGDGAAANIVLAAIEREKASRPSNEITEWILKPFAPGSVNGALEQLQLAVKIDRFEPTAYMAIDPRLITEALGRLAAPLTQDQQKTVYEATFAPNAVRWPNWWSYFPEAPTG